ncbi:3596_t:CDS:2, partial [Acaulospora morrowiae]
MSFPDRYVVSAPGKAILFGEHAVVYGKTAIAGSLEDLRTYMLFEKRLDGYLELNFPDLDLQYALLWPESALPHHLVEIDGKEQKDMVLNEKLLQALKPIVNEGGEKNNIPLNGLQQVASLAFLYLYTNISSKQTSWCGMTVHIRSNLPVGAGLGSSASYSVCSAAGLLLALGHISLPHTVETSNNDLNSNVASAELINRWAFQVEKIIHGNPSGIDNSVATFGNNDYLFLSKLCTSDKLFMGFYVFIKGGAVSYKRGSQHINLAGFHSFRFLLINTNKPRDAKTQIENVRIKRDKYPDIVNPILDAIDAISMSLIKLLESGASQQKMLKELEDLIDLNHYLINSLGVGHPSLEKVHEITTRFNLHSKLTGAGGGGCALVLIPNDFPDEDMKSIKEVFSQNGFDYYETRFGGHGLAAMDATTIFTCSEEFLKIEKKNFRQM